MKSLSGPPSAAARAAMASRASAAAAAATVAASAAASARRRRSTTSRQSADVRALGQPPPAQAALGAAETQHGQGARAAPVCAALARAAARARLLIRSLHLSQHSSLCTMTEAIGSPADARCATVGAHLVDEGRLRIGAALARIAAEAQALTPRAALPQYHDTALIGSP